MKTPLSILDLAHLRVGGTTADAIGIVRETAQHAERWGYKRYWLAEHHNQPGIICSATSLLISHVAANTSTIRVGSGGIMLPNHPPIVVAEQFGTLEAMYPGRIDLGLGRAVGGNTAVARALRHGVHSSGEEFPGQVAELIAYLGDKQPGQAVQAFPGTGTHVPVWILGSSGFGARLAGLLGLPFAFASHFQPANLLPALEIYREAFRPSGTLEKPHVMAGIPIVAAGTDEAAQYLATTHQRKFLNLIRGTPQPLSPPADQLDWDDHERASVNAMLGAAIFGSAETVRRRLGKFIEMTKADELMIATEVFDPQERMRSFEIVAGLGV